MSWIPLSFCALYAATALFGRALWMRWRWGVTHVALYGSTSADGSRTMLASYHATVLAILTHSALWGFGLLRSLTLWPTPPWVEYTGCGLMLGGWVLVVAAQCHLGSAWRVGIVDERTPLQRRGLYHYVRHPIYTALITSTVGMFLIMPTSIMLVAVAVSAIGLNREARLEESHLERMHGDAYRRYRDDTGRWLPRLIARTTSTRH